ncbi:hypothetical protein, partial [Paenibacillus xylanexedens]|uniref:hypothetical protein n=1 Tax=Paenibacillus xylanexedens TaxID=528191 RepID=UPI001C92BD14
LSVVGRGSVVMVKKILLAVKSWDGGKMRSVRGSAKDMGMKMVWSGEWGGRRGGGIVKMRRMWSGR